MLQQASTVQSEAQNGGSAQVDNSEPQPPAQGVEISAASEETMNAIKTKLSDFTKETEALRSTFRQGGLCAPSIHLEEGGEP
jgi:hypothetical protein